MSRPGSCVGRARPRAAGSALGVLWRFSRPHTLIGTTLWIVALYAIAASAGPRVDAFDLALTLLAGACVNVFIVGINQVRTSRSTGSTSRGCRSPPASCRSAGGAADRPRGRGHAAGDGGTQGAVETVAVGVALLVGWAYSCPPLRLKRYRRRGGRAASRSCARSCVNLGVWLHVAGTPVTPASGR